MTRLPTIILDGTAGGNLLTANQVDDLAMGRANILLVHRDEAPKSLKLTPEAFAELTRVRQRGWYYDRAPDRLRTLAHYALEGERRYWCKIRLRGRTAMVVLDLVVTRKEIRELWESSGSDEFNKIARDLGGKAVSFGVWNEIRVPSGQAESCATRMVETFECVVRWPQTGSLP